MFNTTENWLKKLSPLAGALISVVILVALFLTAPVEKILETLVGIDRRDFAVAVGCITLGLLFRGIRWAMMFGSNPAVGWKTASRIIMITLALNAVMPGRLGELARIGLGAQKFSTGIAATTYTLVIERLLDALTLLAFLSCSLVFLPRVDGSLRVEVMGYAMTGEKMNAIKDGLTLICIILLLGVILLVTQSFHRASSWVVSLIPVIGKDLRWRVDTIFKKIRATLNTILEPKRFLLLCLFSISIWILMAIGNFVLSRSLSTGSLSFSQVLVITSITVAASSLPSAPGAWGVFEAAGLFSLVCMGAPLEHGEALAYLIAMHLSQYLPVVTCGVISAVSEHLSPRSIQRAITVSEQPPSTKDTPKSET